MVLHYDVSTPVRFEGSNSQREDSVVATNTGGFHHSYTITKRRQTNASTSTILLYIDTAKYGPLSVGYTPFPSIHFYIQSRRYVVSSACFEFRYKTLLILAL
jgi:hypothetical protein